ncbi:hypothetical protein [Archaeoglobus veneficus]|uniref:Uncharacterized protein n=1 Tax=Archaeoglobus veneficus (strain DSM 11195 / SNP6) TaxID=693661 RepID=F2KMZ7_ARCVS|nr:hypothetical protein [Archaeoglobus veneficus]AEA47273.1 hypothetical protein Arcve_1266 [Archaeoglobus veneficus SNP6]
MLLDELVRKFRNNRVRIIYDNEYPVVSLLFHHVFPSFKENNTYVIVYTDTMCRRLRKMYITAKDRNPSIDEFLNKTKIIKVGTREIAAFGELYAFIPSEGYYDELRRLESLFKKMCDNDVIVTFGLCLIPAIYGREAIGALLKVLDSVPQDVTMVSLFPSGICSEELSSIINIFYDVVMNVRCGEEFFGFGEDTYMVGIEHSVVGDLPPGYMRVRIAENGKLQEI